MSNTDVRYRRHHSGVRSGMRGCVLAAATVIGGCTSPTDTTNKTNGLQIEALTPTAVEGVAGEDVTPVPVVRVTDAAGWSPDGKKIAFVLEMLA